MLLRVKVKPSSKKEEVKKISESEYEVKVSAPPERGKANERLREILADFFGVPKGRVKILRGHTSRIKLVEIE